MEEWKRIPSLPNYIVSSFGNVKRIANDPFWHKDKIRKQQVNQKGYLVVNFQDGNKKFQRKVHQLVSEAFLGPCPKGFEVNHKDSNKLNNIPENLEYISHKANVHHAIKNGHFYFNKEGLSKRWKKSCGDS
jgi:hypothetical protein